MSKDNGHDPATVQMVDILHRIHGELVGVREEVKATNARLDATNERLDRLHDNVLDLHADLVGVNGRLDVLTERVDRLEGRVEKVEDRLTGMALDVHEIRNDLHRGVATQDDHAVRLRRLEEAVFKPAAE
jgi:archaellum component FlaC